MLLYDLAALCRNLAHGGRPRTRYRFPLFGAGNQNLAIVLTARVLGANLGIARALGSIGFSLVIGLAMHLVFRKQELLKAEAAEFESEPEVKRPLWQTAAYFGCMICILVFANWGKPALPRLMDPAVAGLIIGSPCYFRGMSSLCKAFIERCGPLREPKMLLANKPVGVIAVGGFRNGGQELVLGQIQAAMLCFGMVVVGGNPPAFEGGTLVATQDAIESDQLGLETARHVGRRVASFVGGTRKP